jgi:hypothetical protein
MLNRLQDVFKSLQEHEVRYVVIGGIASILHGIPRATFDLDILIEATPGNARRLLDAHPLPGGLSSFPRIYPAGMVISGRPSLPPLSVNENRIIRKVKTRFE